MSKLVSYRINTDGISFNVDAPNTRTLAAWLVNHILFSGSDCEFSIKCLGSIKQYQSLVSVKWNAAHFFYDQVLQTEQLLLSNAGEDWLELGDLVAHLALEQEEEGHKLTVQVHKVRDRDTDADDLDELLSEIL